MSILDMNESTALIPFNEQWTIRPSGIAFDHSVWAKVRFSDSHKICAALEDFFSKDTDYWSALLTRSCALATYYDTGYFGSVMPAHYAEIIYGLIEALAKVKEWFEHNEVLAWSSDTTYTLKFTSRLATPNFFQPNCAIRLVANVGGYQELEIELRGKVTIGKNGTGAVRCDQYIDTKKYRRIEGLILPGHLPAGWVTVPKEIPF